MVDVINKEEIDLLYVLGKLRFFAQNKFYFLSMTLIGLITGIFFNTFISPMRLEIEFRPPKYKSIISGPSFESTLQSLAASIITSGKLSSSRDSSGFIYRFVITGDGQNEGSAKIQAIENSSDLMNRALKNLLIKAIDSYVLVETSIAFTKSSDEVSGELGLMDLEKKLKRLELIRNKFLNVTSIKKTDNLQKKISDFNAGEQQLGLNKETMDLSLRPVELDIASTKFDIEMLKMRIEAVKFGAIPEASINQFSKLLANALKDDTLTSKLLLSNSFALIEATEKLLDKNSEAFDRLSFLKSIMKNYEYAEKLMMANGKILNPEKKYKILYCTLGGAFLSFLIATLFLILRRDIFNKYRFSN